MPTTTTAYMSFLGATAYTPTTYTWNGHAAAKSPYVQEAELELLLARGEIDRTTPVFIFGTPTSKKKHWERPLDKDGGDVGPGLRPRLAKLGFEPTFVETPEDLSTAAQWSTFEAVLEQIPFGARLTIDMTNGYRAVPVVFSSALHFLRLAREVSLTHVLYGLYDRDPAARSPIVDYAEFFAIQDWTEAVSRLVEDADARRLVELATAEDGLRVAAFEPELTEALMAVTDAVRSVQVHGIEPKVRQALKLVDQAGTDAEPAHGALLRLVRDKFGVLVSLPPLDERYTPDYFELQRRFIRLLLEHRLFMQAFTAMREYVGSLGLRAYKPGHLKFTNGAGRKKRRYADVFVQMLARPQSEWAFGGNQSIVETLLPHYEQIAEEGLCEDLQKHLKVIGDIRNGFDHAWTSKASLVDNIADKGTEELAYLTEVTARILALQPPATPKPEAKRPKRMLVLMNHEPTAAQVADAEASQGVSSADWALAREELRRAWGAIDPAAEKTPEELLAGIREWITQESKAGDVIWVQGELGATLAAAREAAAQGLTPIYATSRRESATKEEADGSMTKTSRFVHVRFRKLRAG